MKINKDKYPQDVLLNTILQEITDEVMPSNNDLEEKNKRIQHSKRIAKKRILNSIIFLLIIIGLFILFYMPEVQKKPTQQKQLTKTIKKPHIKYKPEKSIKVADIVTISKKEDEKPQKPLLTEREIAKKRLLEQMK